MNLKNQVQQMDEMVAQGAIVDAVKNYFSDKATTSDYNNLKTTSKSEMIQKMENFVGAIAQVKSIQHHHSIVGDHVSASEFTFNFDMKDGSEILWHEIIRRKWNDEAKVVHEEYFLA